MALSVVPSFSWIVSGSASITIVIEPFGWTFATAPAAVAGATAAPGLAAGLAAGLAPGLAAGAAGLAGAAVAAGETGAAGAQATARTPVINTRLAALRRALSHG